MMMLIDFSLIHEHDSDLLTFAHGDDDRKIVLIDIEIVSTSVEDIIYEKTQHT